MARHRARDRLEGLRGQEPARRRVAQARRAGARPLTHALDLIETPVPAAPLAVATGPFDRILAVVNHAIVLGSPAALVIASAVLSYSVFARYFFHVRTDWQDELAVFLIVGAVFMAGAAVQVRRGHIGIGAVASLLSPRVHAIRQLLVDIASFAFCSFFGWKGL